MGLTQTQRSILERALAVGGGSLGVALTDEAAVFLVAVIAEDLGLQREFPEFSCPLQSFFTSEPPESLVIQGVNLYQVYEKLLGLCGDADTYFSCLSSLHKSRLKYAKILQSQPFPTLDQVGPRSLLQYGAMSAQALAVFLVWRKWIFDIDNRAGQETGYLFEPIIANAIGGVPLSARRSPIRRRADPTKGRQVDCIRERRAYEFKIRVTIAASGQGRWSEELEFPADCKSSGYVPVLVVLDPTPNPKLGELVEAFKSQGGEIHVGQEAWDHLENMAGQTMGQFLDKYVRKPMDDILNSTPEELPGITFSLSGDVLNISIGNENYEVFRIVENVDLAIREELPDDIDSEVPGA